MQQTNPMGAVWLLALLALGGMAVFGAKGKWKLINLGIIAGFVGFGIFAGWVAGMWAHNNALGTLIAIPLATLLGVAGSLGCYRRNLRRKKEKRSEPRSSEISPPSVKSEEIEMIKWLCVATHSPNAAQVDGGTVRSSRLPLRTEARRFRPSD